MTQENHLKAILKKYVLRTDLKTLKDSACLISEGREFQSFGAQDIMTLASDFSLSISCSLSLSFIFRFSFPVYFSLFLLNKLCVSRNMTNGHSLIESLGSTRTLNTFISLNIN